VTDSSFEAHRVVLHLPDDLPPARKHAPAPAPASLRPLTVPSAYHPMATCPRGLDGSLKENVWIAFPHGRSPLLYLVGQRPKVGDDKRFGRLGWLPGYITQANLPPEPASAPLAYAWRPMATCPRRTDGTLSEHIWISYSNGLRPLKHVVSLTPKEDDARFGRLGWLPGYVDEADLPEVPK